MWMLWGREAVAPDWALVWMGRLSALGLIPHRTVQDGTLVFRLIRGLQHLFRAPLPVLVLGVLILGCSRALLLNFLLEEVPEIIVGDQGVTFIVECLGGFGFRCPVLLWVAVGRYAGSLNKQVYVFFWSLFLHMCWLDYHDCGDGGCRS